MENTASHERGPDRFLLGFCAFALAWAIVVFQAGGFTTSIGAGMAFLDWPLSNGSVNPPGWLTDLDMFAEHSHRLAAAKFGLLLAGLVVFQGLLGGLRVLLDQQNTGTEHNMGGVGFGIAHAVTAQLTVALLACLTLAHTRSWREFKAAPGRGLRVAAIAAPALLLAVMVAGAVMRQNRVTLWVSDGGALFLPDQGQGWIWAVNAAHRAGALLAAAGVAWLLAAAWRAGAPRRLVGLVAGALALQLALGILAIGLPANPHVRTVHVIIGAVLFSGTCALALMHLRRATPATT
jgi:cytochrome c oxidase assembly protein subunit 15